MRPSLKIPEDLRIRTAADPRVSQRFEYNSHEIGFANAADTGVLVQARRLQDIVLETRVAGATI
jgi:hypothetical protein